MATETLARRPTSGVTLSADNKTESKLEPFLEPLVTSHEVDIQAAWAARPVRERLRVLRQARNRLAQRSAQVAAAISPELARSPADTLAAELLPLLEAIRFLDRETARILSPRFLGRRGLPFWLAGVRSEVHRVPFGRILVIAPSNYPLFLAGVQVFQALAAGNAVVWKPGVGGAAVARLVARTLVESGLPEALLEVTDDTIEAAEEALAKRPDKVFFTGSSAVGRRLLERCARTATPCVMELSGNDAMIVLPSADLDRVVKALAFGVRLNGSATCMAPRRVLLVDCSPERSWRLIDQISAAFAEIRPVSLPANVRRQLDRLLAEARSRGAKIIGDASAKRISPLVVLDGTPEMQIAQEDLFAPVLTLIPVTGIDGARRAQTICPFGLTTSIFGEERSAYTLAGQLICGTVTINDLIVPTADPRVPFGGRRESGFGVTRGAEGLLEMTAVQVISTRRGSGTRQYETTGEPHSRLFQSIITATHAGTWTERWAGLRRAIAAAMEFKTS